MYVMSNQKQYNYSETVNPIELCTCYMCEWLLNQLLTPWFISQTETKHITLKLMAFIDKQHNYSVLQNYACPVLVQLFHISG